jgi:hypothetical protein
MKGKRKERERERKTLLYSLDMRQLDTYPKTWNFLMMTKR